MPEIGRYRLSFSTGGLFVAESARAAELYVSGRDWDDIQKLLVDRQIVSFKTISAGHRVAREIITRLKSLSRSELEFLAGGDRENQVNMIWLAVCRTYELIADFVAEELNERLLALRNDLSLAVFESFLVRKSDWHPEIAALTASTRAKLRQVLFRMLREAGYYDDRNGLVGAQLSSTFLKFAARNFPNDLVFFPGRHAGHHKKAG